MIAIDFLTKLTMEIRSSLFESLIDFNASNLPIFTMPLVTTAEMSVLLIYHRTFSVFTVQDPPANLAITHAIS